MGKFRGYTPRIYQNAISVRDGWSCHYCGCELVPSGYYLYIQMGKPIDELLEHHYIDNTCLEKYNRGVKEATIDHKTPLSKGGLPRDLNNMVLSCRSCNSKKRTKNYEDFKK